MLAAALLRMYGKRTVKMKTKWFKQVGAFFAAVYLISGLLWTPVLLSGQGMSTTANKLTVALITFVPSLLGILFVYLTRDREGRQDFWRRVLRWPRGRTRYAVAAMCLPAVLAFGAYFLAAAADGRSIQLAYASEMLRTPGMLFQFLAVELLFGAVSEELGWRGFALDQLQSRWNALTASLILGIVWGLWHLPAFFVPGLAQYEMRSPTTMALFVVIVILGSVLQTWGYNNTGRSILVGGILMHFFANAAVVFTNGIFSGYAATPSYSYIQIALNLLAVITITAIWKPQNLARTPASEAM